LASFIVAVRRVGPMFAISTALGAGRGLDRPVNRPAAAGARGVGGGHLHRPPWQALALARLVQGHPGGEVVQLRSKTGQGVIAVRIEAARYRLEMTS
jgi:hypothetical protein